MTFTAILHRIAFLAFIGVGSSAFSQAGASPAATATTAPTLTQVQINAQLLQAAQLSAISAKTGVPAACVKRLLDIRANGQKIADPTERRVAEVKAIQKMLDFLDDQLCTTYLILSSDQYRNASKAARSRLVPLLLQDTQLQQGALKEYKTLSQQTGSSSGTGGTTSLVSKGAAARVLSLASEYGAVTESTSGQTTTINGTLAGVPLLLLKNGLLQNCSTQIYTIAVSTCIHGNLVSYLGRISYSVAYDASPSSQTVTGTATTTGTTTTAVPTSFTASTHSISAISGKWIILQGKPATGDVQSALKTFEDNKQAATLMPLVQFFQLLENVEPVATNLADWQSGPAADALLQAMQRDTEADTSLAKSDMTHTALAFKGLASQFVANLGLPVDSSPEIAANSDIIVKGLQLALDYAKYIGQEQAISATIARPAVLTFEYDDNRPASQPQNSVFRAIYQAKLKPVTITANGAVSIYNSQPSAAIPGAGRLRDVQFAFEADHDFSITLPASGKVGMTSSAAFYFQNQRSPAILNVTPGNPVNGVTITGLPSTATQVYAQTGNISVGQLKLTIGSGSSIKVPFSVTYSNRTELVTSPVWRGQVGISYDFDSLFQPK
jgi:hypothetical protein